MRDAIGANDEEIRRLIGALDVSWMKTSSPGYDDPAREYAEIALAGTRCRHVPDEGA